MAIAASLAASSAFAIDLPKITVHGSTRSFPESISATADGTVYAGSLSDGIVYKAAPGVATAEPWTAAQDGGMGIFGVLADEKSKTLWACFASKDLSAAAVRGFDIATAQLKATYPLPGGGLCNDMTIGKDGAMYVSDTKHSRILRRAPDGTDLEDWLIGDDLTGIDGIAFSADWTLYVNSVSKSTISRVDIDASGKAGKVTPLQLSQAISAPDGMRFADDGKLYVAENKGGKVDQVTISGDAATVKTLQDGFVTPTGVSKVRDTLWILEAKQTFRKNQDDPGGFFIYALKVPAN